jgi:hypothetical protein
MGLSQKIYEVDHTLRGLINIYAGHVRFERDFVVFVGDTNSDIIEAIHSDYIRSVTKVD